MTTFGQIFVSFFCISFVCLVASAIAIKNEYIWKLFFSLLITFMLITIMILMYGFVIGEQLTKAGAI